MTSADSGNVIDMIDESLLDLHSDVTAKPCAVPRFVGKRGGFFGGVFESGSGYNDFLVVEVLIWKLWW